MRSSGFVGAVGSGIVAWGVGMGYLRARMMSALTGAVEGEIGRRG